MAKNKFIGDDEDTDALVVTRAEDVDENAEPEEEDPDAETAEADFERWAAEQDELDAKAKARRDAAELDGESEEEFMRWIEEMEELDRKAIRQDAAIDEMTKEELLGLISAEGEDVTAPQGADEIPLVERSVEYLREYAHARMDGFNPDQERDADGKFGSGGGGGGAAKKPKGEKTKAAKKEESSSPKTTATTPAGKEHRDSAKEAVLKARELREKVKANPNDAKLAAELKSAEKAAKSARAAARKAEKSQPGESAKQTVEKQTVDSTSTGQKTVEQMKPGSTISKFQQKLNEAHAQGKELDKQKATSKSETTEAVTPTTKPPNMSDGRYKKMTDESGNVTHAKQVDDYEHSGDTENEADHLSSLGALVTKTEDLPPEDDDDGDGSGRVEYRLPKGVNHFQFDALLTLSYMAEGHNSTSEVKKFFQEAKSLIRAGKGKQAEPILMKALAGKPILDKS